MCYGLWPRYSQTDGVAMLFNTGQSMRATKEWDLLNKQCALYVPREPMPPIV